MRDLFLVSRSHADKPQQGIPDLVFGTKILADDGSGRHVYTPRAILELKRSGIVEGLLPVFGNLLNPLQSDSVPNLSQSTGSIAITKSIYFPIG